MTHKDIYIKFMIEYDKANVTSSYPSLTEYEVATVLDKAYNALIAQKITGNNVRRSGFETDTKSISDLLNLVVKTPSNISLTHLDDFNVAYGNLPDKFLYFVNARIKGQTSSSSRSPIDDNKTRYTDVQLVNHDIADRFIVSTYNLPWIKIPVAYIEDGKIYVVYDPVNKPVITDGLQLTYIKTPNKFVKDENDMSLTYFDWGSGDAPAKYQFECNDTVAEELISLAVAFALENVESNRLNSKLNMRGLEA